jgi:hypothetical protein
MYIEAGPKPAFGPALRGVCYYWTGGQPFRPHGVMQP